MVITTCPKPGPEETPEIITEEIIFLIQFFPGWAEDVQSSFLLLPGCDTFQAGCSNW